MPELPEVETIRRGLLKYLVGHTIKEVVLNDPRLFTGNIGVIKGAKVLNVERRGKGLIITFDNGYALAVHVKMTGQFIFRSPKTSHFIVSSKVGGILPNQHTRAIFTLDYQATLFYNDVRRFGWMKLVKKEDVMKIPFFAQMGPEPLNDLTPTGFATILKSHTIPVKTLLMDQKKIGGVGNIYANDALWEAKIDPRRRTSSLSEKEIHLLFKALHDVLKFSIDHGAASDANYVDALGQDGRYQEHFKVYRRTNLPCSRCSSVIERITLGGRGTFFCPQCQQ